MLETGFGTFLWAVRLYIQQMKNINNREKAKTSTFPHKPLLLPRGCRKLDNMCFEYAMENHEQANSVNSGVYLPHNNSQPCSRPLRIFGFDETVLIYEKTIHSKWQYGRDNLILASVW